MPFSDVVPSGVLEIAEIVTRCGDFYYQPNGGLSYRRRVSVTLHRFLKVMTKSVAFSLFIRLYTAVIKLHLRLCRICTQLLSSVLTAYSSRMGFRCRLRIYRVEAAQLEFIIINRRLMIKKKLCNYFYDAVIMRVTHYILFCNY